MTQEFIVTITPDGKLPESIRHKLSGALQAFAGQRVSIKLEKYRKRRSNSQNAFHWGIVVPIVRDWLESQGYHFDAEETHEFIVRHIWKHTEVVLMDDQPYERRLSSRELPTMEWENKIDLVRQFGAEHGFFVPFPHEEAA